VCVCVCVCVETKQIKLINCLKLDFRANISYAILHIYIHFQVRQTARRSIFSLETQS